MTPAPVPPVPCAPDAPEGALPADLLADLSDWTVHLQARSYTEVSVQMLLRDLRRTVPTALGYRLVLTGTPGLPAVSITVADERLAAERVGSVLTFDLPMAHQLAARVVFYAGGRGRLDRLAALLRLSTTFAGGSIRLDGAPDGDVEPGVRGLADHTRVNYALGVLIGRGLTIDEARRHLDRSAAERGSLQAAAEHVLGNLGG